MKPARAKRVAIAAVAVAVSDRIVVPPQVAAVGTRALPVTSAAAAAAAAVVKVGAADEVVRVAVVETIAIVAVITITTGESRNEERPNSVTCSAVSRRHYG
jgi:hypothetical protein